MNPWYAAIVNGVVVVVAVVVRPGVVVAVGPDEAQPATKAANADATSSVASLPTTRK
jgi:hypothetical protein